MSMKLDHVNVRTGRLEEMRKWYADVLGLKDGWRPPFPFPGAWLYAGDDPIVHLVGVESTPVADEDDIRLEHFALKGDDLEALRGRIKAANLECHDVRVPGTDILQLNIYDPDGNHIHIDFRVPEGAD
jgi:catechol 2,3-dioxygenase-like lactoylglutathione lyase family enzyme